MTLVWTNVRRDTVANQRRVSGHGQRIRHRHPRRHHHGRQWWNAVPGRRRGQGRRHRGSRQGVRPRPRGDRCRRPVRDAGLRRHPHPLRRPGDVGLPARPILMARRDHRRDGQLRRRLRPGAQEHPGRRHRADGRGRGYSRPLPARGSRLDLGKFRRLPHRAGAPQPRHRFLRAAAACTDARLRHGRPRAEPGGRESGRHRPDARDRRGCGARRRVRLLHLPHHRAQDAGRRPHSDAARAGSRAHGDRHGAEGRREGVHRDDLRLEHSRSGDRIRHGAAHHAGLRTSAGVLAEPAA